METKKCFLKIQHVKYFILHKKTKIVFIGTHRNLSEFQCQFQVDLD